MLGTKISTSRMHKTSQGFRFKSQLSIDLEFIFLKTNHSILLCLEGNFDRYYLHLPIHCTGKSGRRFLVFEGRLNFALIVRKYILVVLVPRSRCLISLACVTPSVTQHCFVVLGVGEGAKTAFALAEL